MEGPLLIGIAGGSASGKSLVTSTLIENLGSREVVMIEQDSYYKDFAGLPVEERAKLNFDHPDAFDRELLLDHMEALLRGQPIEKPTYDFTHHSRLPETVRVEGHRVIVLEGILVLEDPALRRLMDIKVFIDTDADVRLIRRIRRDTGSASAAWSRSSSSTSRACARCTCSSSSLPSATPTSSFPREGRIRWPSTFW